MVLWELVLLQLLQRVDIGDGVLVLSSSATGKGTAAEGQARLGCGAS